jgi:hypothetical protein
MESVTAILVALSLIFRFFGVVADRRHPFCSFARLCGRFATIPRDRFAQPELLRVLRYFAGHWTNLVAVGQLVAVCGVLLGSLTYQFVLGELPCPLCVIQRMAFLLACV